MPESQMKQVDLDNVSFQIFVEYEPDKFDYYKRIGLLMKPDPGKLDVIENWTYGKVKELQMSFTDVVTFEMIPQILSFAHDFKPNDIWKMKWHQVFRYYNHIVKEVEMIVEKEKVLSFEPDADQEEAGIERINQFGVFSIIDKLAGGNVLMYSAIEEVPYYLIFAKLHYETETAKYLKNLTRIRNRSKK